MTMLRTLSLLLLLEVGAVYSQQSAIMPATIVSGPVDRNIMKYEEGAKLDDEMAKNPLFECTVKGTGPLTVTWYEGDPASNQKELDMTASGSRFYVQEFPENDRRVSKLKIKIHVTSADHGTIFQCKVNNDYGEEMSNLAVLHVYKIDTTPPPDTAEPAINNRLGMKMEVPCKPFQNNGFPLPTTSFAWKNKVTQATQIDFSNTKGRVQKVPINAETTQKGIASTLIYAYTEATDNKENFFITCLQRNEVLGVTVDSKKYPLIIDISSSQNQPLELVYPPPGELPWTRKVMVGSSFSLKAIFVSKPLPTYEVWELPNEAVKSADKSNFATVKKITDTDKEYQKSELDFFNAGPDHDGTYKLCANSGGQNMCATFQVEVQYPPEFKKKPAEKFVGVGRDAVFECEGERLMPLVSNPTWYINGKEAGPSSNVLITPSTLTITNAQKPKDIMVVQCLLTNSLGPKGYAVQSGALNVLDQFTWAGDGKGPSEKYTVDKENDQATFSFLCNYTADPLEEVTVTWYQNVPEDRQPIKADEVLEKKHPGFVVDENGRRLAIDLSKSNVGTKPREVYAGTYTCIVEAKKGDYVTKELVATQSLTFKADAGAVAPVASAGMIWIIGPIVAGIVILVIIILIICMIHRNRTVAYRIGEKEIKAGHDPERDLKESGFQDFARPNEEPAKPTKGSLNEPEAAPESDDNDSLKEYGDIDAGKFNEDGSFIGQYGEGKKQRPTDSVV